MYIFIFSAVRTDLMQFFAIILTNKYYLCLTVSHKLSFDEYLIPQNSFHA